MATVVEIRRANARMLAEQAGGLAAFAKAIARSDPYVSQLIGRNPSREIGHATARLIEEAFGKPEGWLDAQQQDAPLEPAAQAIARAFQGMTPQDRERVRAMIFVLTGIDVPKEDSSAN
jgi:hypothetical protein